jgi:hypothetical protein
MGLGFCGVVDCGSCGAAIVFFGANDATANMRASDPAMSVTNFIRDSPFKP